MFSFCLILSFRHYLPMKMTGQECEHVCSVKFSSDIVFHNQIKRVHCNFTRALTRPITSPTCISEIRPLVLEDLGWVGRHAEKIWEDPTNNETYFVSLKESSLIHLGLLSRALCDRSLEWCFSKCKKQRRLSECEEKCTKIGNDNHFRSLCEIFAAI